MGHLGGRSMSTQRDSSSICLTVLGWMFKCPSVLLRSSLMDAIRSFPLSLCGPPALTAHSSQQPQQRLRGQPEPQPAPAPLWPCTDPQPRQGPGTGSLSTGQLPTPHCSSCECPRIRLQGQPDAPILALGASPSVAAIQSHLALLPVGSFQSDC